MTWFMLRRRTNVSANRMRGGVVASTLFVVLRLALTPLRIRVMTWVLAPADYGVVTMISMAACGMAMLLSMGGFEYWLRALPAASPAAREGIFREVFPHTFVIGACFALLTMGAIPASVWGGEAGVRVSTPLVGLYFLALFHIFQRLYYLLGARRHYRARLLQILWSDVWFLCILPFGARGGSWTANQALGVWTIWLGLTILGTWKWIPVTWIKQDEPAFRPVLFPAWMRMGLPMLPVILGEWIFRLAGQMVLLHAISAEAMAFYALALNIALVGAAMGVPFLDFAATEMNRMSDRPLTPENREALRALFTKSLRWLLALNLPVMAALIFLAQPLVRFLAAPAFHSVALFLPNACALPLLMLGNLLVSRFALTLRKPRIAGFASSSGAVVMLLLGILWAKPYGITGVLNAVSAGLCVSILFQARGIRLRHWIDWREMRLLPVALTVPLLAVSFSFLTIIETVPAVLLGLAGVMSAGILVITGLVKLPDLKSVVNTSA